MKEIHTSEVEQNRAKIHGFVGKIALQIVIFTAIVFATIQGNVIAQWALVIYALIVAVAIAIFTVISLAPAKMMATSDLSKFRKGLTPSATVARSIASIFTIFEIALLFTYGWFVIGTLWILAEILQRTMYRKVKQALALQESGEVEVLERVTEMPDPIITLDKDQFEELISEDVEKFMTEISNINSRLRKLFSDNNGAPPPEGSLNHKEMLELNARQEEIAKELEAAIDGAANKSIKS